MSIIKGLRDYLVADVGVNAGVEGRVFRNRAQQKEAMPYITLQRVSTNRTYHLEGQEVVVAAVIQVDLWSDVPNKVDSLGEEVRSALSGFRGSMGTEAVWGCTCLRDDDFAERPLDASDSWKFRRSMDFRIHHTEPTAGVGKMVQIVTKTANYTVGATDQVVLCDASGGGFTISLPAAADSSGRLLYIKKIDTSANVVAVDGSGSETIDDDITQQLNSYNAITITCDGEEWWIL